MNTSKKESLIPRLIALTLAVALGYAVYSYIIPHYKNKEVRTPTNSEELRSQLSFRINGLSSIRTFAVEAGAETHCPDLLAQADVARDKAIWGLRFDKIPEAQAYTEEAVKLYQECEQLATKANLHTSRASNDS